jgi:spore maturation protein CgeB
MKVLVVDTYYPAYLASLYKHQVGLRDNSYDVQMDALIDTCFGTSDFYSRHLSELGCDTQDLIVNCLPLQIMWAREHDFPLREWALNIPHRLYRLPLVGATLSRLPGLLDVALAQIKNFSPDVLYCQDLSFFPPNVLQEIKKTIPLVVGQIACPLPPNEFLQNYDLILTSFPHFVPRLRSLGIHSEYFKIGFDSKVLEKLGVVNKDIPVSFVGGISRHHGNAIPTLEYLADKTPIDFFGYGASNLRSNSPILKKHHGEVWGLEMYRTLARSKMTVNRHINVAENYANNMRLYEATGVGSLLITDYKDNLADLFEIGKEVIVYHNEQEAAELINYYIAHPKEAEKIAKAGQKRTLETHTYAHRMKELMPILQGYLRGVV